MYIFVHTFENHQSTGVCMEMRTHCESCGQTLTPDGLAYICSYECTYCPTCADRQGLRCPNCQGELVRRPRRLSQTAADHDGQA